MHVGTVTEAQGRSIERVGVKSALAQPRIKHKIISRNTKISNMQKHKIYYICHLFTNYQSCKETKTITYSKEKNQSVTNRSRNDTNDRIK